VTLADSMQFLARPVMKGLCKYESLVDGTLNLVDFAEMNDWLDVQSENDARYADASRREQHQ